MPKPVRVLFVTLVLALIPWASGAQTAIDTVLSAPETDSFPEIQTTLRIRDSEGRFVSGLTPADVVLIEDGMEVPVSNIDAQAPGAQIVVAINPDPGFALRDSTGTSRYDYVVQALKSWAEGRENTDQDSLTLTMTGGPAESLISYPEFISTLESAPSDHRSAVESVETLNNALNLANATNEDPQKGRAILYITAPVDTDAIPFLESFAASAQDSRIRVFVWLVTSEAFFESRGALALQQLAEDTGGRLFAFSGTETLPDPEAYFDGLRQQYRITYRSEIRTSGEFTLAARIQTGEIETSTEPVAFNLTVLPPNPIFVSPPDEIYRSLVPDADGNLSAERRAPVEQPIEILIEFPDGYPRDLLRTTLYMDGEIVAENTEPPFDRFTWSLAGIDTSGRRLLQVEAVDTFNLSSISLQTPVDITVQSMPEGFAPVIARNSPLIVTVVVLLVGGMLIVVLLRFRHVRPVTQPGSGRRTKSEDRDPVTQPVLMESRPATARLSRWTNRLHWPQRSTPHGEPIAFLERIAGPDSPAPLISGAPLPVLTSEVTLGKDPSQATFVLDDPSVAELHARLHRNAEHEFYISDYGTISGTYINYRPTNGRPTRIEHGDQIHFGTVGFRFRINPPPQTTPPSIEPEDKNLDP